MMISKDNQEQPIRAEDLILADIWDALRKENTIRSMDMGSFTIDVKGGDVYLKGYLPQENNLPLIESIIHSVMGVVEVHNHLRTNEGILADIWDALWRKDTIRSFDINSLSIGVKDGEVYLNGHLAREYNLPLIDNIAWSVAGVVAVHNQLVVDRDLVMQVTQALDRDECTRSFILPISAFHGWISISGEVPAHEIQHAVEKVAGGVPNVRGVITLPRVSGESPCIPRRMVQPRIGAVVYGENGAAGVVTQVVVHPDNRLVTQVVVRSNELISGSLVARETVIPLEAIDQASNENTLLVRNEPSLSAYPTFFPDWYPLALITWKAPYPYTAGEVRWPLGDTLETWSLPGSWREIKPGVKIEEVPERVMSEVGA